MEVPILMVTSGVAAFTEYLFLATTKIVAGSVKNFVGESFPKTVSFLLVESEVLR